MKTGDILKLNNCTSARAPVSPVFVGYDKTVAWITAILAMGIIATGIVATAVAGFRQGETAIHRTAETLAALEKQVRRVGPWVAGGDRGEGGMFLRQL